MRALLRLSRGIDWANAQLAVIANLLIIAICVVSAGNAAVRYAVSYSSNAWLEIQWYGFAALVMLGGAYTLNKNEHVRVDLIYGFVGDRTKLWIDLFGNIDIYWGSIPWIVMQLMLVAILIMWPGSVTMMLDNGPKVDPSKMQITVPSLDTGTGGLGPSPFGAPPPDFGPPPKKQ